MKSNKTRLENIVKNHQSRHHVRNHPHEHISTHIAGIMFLAMFFLFSVGMFFMAEPGTQTSFAVVDFSNVDLKIGEKVGGFVDTMLAPEVREEFMFIAYISWILIIGVVNLYFVDREYRMHGKK